jgi:hypothetical protein
MSEVTKEDVLATEESRGEAEQSVMYPEADTKPVNFMSHEIKLQALPIWYSRRISKQLAPFKKHFATLVGAKEDVQQAAAVQDIDEPAIDALLDAAVIILEFYKEVGKLDEEITKEQIEKVVSTAQLVDFVKAQVEANNRSDFLLTVLQIIMSLSSAVADIANAVQVETKKVTRPPSS